MTTELLCKRLLLYFNISLNSMVAGQISETLIILINFKVNGKRVIYYKFNNTQIHPKQKPAIGLSQGSKNVPDELKKKGIYMASIGLTQKRYLITIIFL